MYLRPTTALKSLAMKGVPNIHTWAFEGFLAAQASMSALQQLSLPDTTLSDAGVLTMLDIEVVKNCWNGYWQ